jgi:hypothetical protein
MEREGRVSKHGDVTLEDRTAGRWTLPRQRKRDEGRLKDLTRTEVGELVEVKEVVFGSVQEYCEGAGIGPGTRLRVRSRDNHGGLELEDVEGDSVAMTWDFALFVWVRDSRKDD